MANDQITVTGKVKVELIRDGKVIQTGGGEHNVVTTNGKNALASLVNSASAGTSWVTNIGFGTGTTAEAAGDSALQTELTTSTYSGYARPSVTRSNPSANVIQYVATLTGGTPSGGSVTVTEAGLFNQASGGTLIAHKAGTVSGSNGFGSYTLASSSDSLQVTWQITFS